MTNYIIDGHDISRLFDEKYPTIRFSENPKNHIPDVGSMVYTVWNNDDKFIYVGISGVGQSSNTPLEKRNPVSRMISHRSGRRSGDQFCIYVHDFFVIPELIKKGIFEPSHGLLDRLTKQYIHENLSYRFCCFQTEDSNKIVRKIETEIINGYFGLKPFLNSKSSE